MIAWTNLRWLWLSAAVASADLGLKRVMEKMLAEASMEVLPVFSLALGYNRGISFGMLADLGGWQRWPLIILALAIAMGLAVWLARQPVSGETASKSALALVIGGAMGNAVDRMAFGHVTDFIQLHWGGWAWPTFNFADVAISLGAILLVASSSRRESA
ncbi:signal peptidase II [Magnetospirillum sp. 64-120]|uniref:signal peptidase II n=1 Tax=Magnetospirillum sp. 64-120 TaxID=1895778 RepID=UPI00092B692F|nr:signal peptidase II [Magnetospirillum sp. 64-120]OJX71864.1 MAG: signal peptidase II [Magnetospirillum sp. 64-120]